MQRKLKAIRQSDDEAIKKSGLLLDFGEIARKGKMSAEEGVIAKWYGIYSARQTGNFMVRVVVPGGILTSAQARTLAQVAKDYAQGRLTATTRQSIQLHWVKLAMLPLVIRDLAKAGLSTFHGCGDVTRNISICPRAAICPYGRFDVTPYAKKTTTLLASSRDLDNLPRKFKITFSGCGAGCAQPHINCVGLIAVTRRLENGTVEPGFRVMIGGGLGWKPFMARELFSFIPKDQVILLCRMIGLFYRDYGDRFDRSISRLKFVLDKYDTDFCRDKITELFVKEGGNQNRFDVNPIEECGDLWPENPLSNIVDYKESMFVPQGIRIPKGELKFQQFLKLAECSEIYGDKHLHTTNRQNIEIHGVRHDSKLLLMEEVKKIGLHVDGYVRINDIVACVGTTYCPLGITRTREIYDVLEELVSREEYIGIREKLRIIITGCPNSCAPYILADIGLSGLRLRKEAGSAEGYLIRLGGCDDQFGEVLGQYKVGDCVNIIISVLDEFVKNRVGDESFTDHIKRVGISFYQQLVSLKNISYPAASTLQEYSVFTGLGLERLDQKTFDKDIPCQNACPAKTNIPEYIRQIALGNYNEAYRVNQEGNVFPGVLGRVCTRPCEDKCRRQWTSTDGPVTICHLKRAASEHKKKGANSLPPWFGATGKKIAIVGSGPSGLSAARELKRYGHEVTIFEREKFLGGMMRFGIPLFRLPRSVVDEEIKAIIDNGIHVRLQTTVNGKNIWKMIDEFDAVLVAAGSLRSKHLRTTGLPEGVGFSGLSFIKQYNVGESWEISKNVVVIGGGFTAIDCARVARRMLGKNGSVKIMYRRTEGQMSASPNEIWQVKLEGIEVETLVSPVQVKCQNKKTESVTFCRNRLIVSDGIEGKLPIEPIVGSDFKVPCGTLIFAIGQDRTSGILPDKITMLGGNRASNKKVFVAGDYSTGSLDVIHAVASGKAAAEEIDTFLLGKTRRKPRVLVELAEDTGRIRDYDLFTPSDIPTIPTEERIGDVEVERSFDNSIANINAKRCYLCDFKFEIDQNKCIHCDWCIKVTPRECIRKLSRLFHDEDGAPCEYVETTIPNEATYIWIDSDNCIRCGNCMRICPTRAISLRQTKSDCAHRIPN